MEWSRDGYVISDQPERIDLDLTWAFLRASYWSPGVARETVERAIEGSLVFGLYAADGTQAGFARVVTDRATFAWIADVFIVEEHRRAGLGKWLVETVLSHRHLQGLRQTLLATADAHDLYARYGFEPVTPDRFMVRRP